MSPNLPTRLDTLNNGWVGSLSADGLKDNEISLSEAGWGDHFLTKNRSNKLTKNEFSFDSSPLFTIST